MSKNQNKEKVIEEKEKKVMKPKNKVLDKTDTLYEQNILELTEFVNNKLVQGYSTKTLTVVLMNEKGLTQRNAENFIRKTREVMHENFKDVLYDLHQRLILELIDIKNSTKSNLEKFRAIDLINKMTFVAPIQEEESFSNRIVDEKETENKFITININPSN